SERLAVVTMKHAPLVSSASVRSDTYFQRYGPVRACARTPFGVSPKHERKSRLKYETSEKPACNAMSEIRTLIEFSAVRSVNACFNRSSMTCALKHVPDDSSNRWR